MTVHNFLNGSILTWLILPQTQTNKMRKKYKEQKNNELYYAPVNMCITVCVCVCVYKYSLTQAGHPCKQDCFSLSHSRTHSQNQDLLPDQQNGTSDASG